MSAGSMSASVDPRRAPSRLQLRLPRSLLDPRLAALPVDGEGLVPLQLQLEGGYIRQLQPLDPAQAPPLPLALTPLVEPHAHLDKGFTAAAFPNPGGTMAGALAQNLREGEQRSAAGVLERGERLLDQAWRYGLRAMRSHVDSGGPAAAVSWPALRELQRRWAGRVELQLVALAPLAHWSSPAGEALARQVAAGGGLLGGVLGPPFARSRDDRRHLAALLALAERLGVGLDLHIDEADRQPACGVRLLLSLLGDRPAPVPITCSHAASLALLPPGPLERLAERLAAAAVAVVALPLTNLWLLGRRPGQVPLLRPQAPWPVLQRAGVTVAIGGDNVQDPWYPAGDGDPLELLRLAPLTSHLWPAGRRGLAPFTTAPARLLDLPWDGLVRPGAPADLLLLEAGGWGDLLARAPQRLVLRAGRWLPPSPLQQPPQRLAAASMG